MIRVIIADDHAVVREGIRRILADAGDVEVVAEAADGTELLAQLERAPCDVVLLDLSMPGLPGLEALRTIRAVCPSLPILVLSMHPEEQYAARTIRLGASGYLDKAGKPSELIHALRIVAGGSMYVTPPVAEQLVDRARQASSQLPHEALSNREFEVVCLMAAGKKLSDIARELSISVKTVSTFRGRILEKLGLRTTAEIIRYAIEHGLSKDASC